MKKCESEVGRADVIFCNLGNTINIGQHIDVSNPVRTLEIVMAGFDSMGNNHRLYLKGTNYHLQR